MKLGWFAVLATLVLTMSVHAQAQIKPTRTISFVQAIRDGYEVKAATGTTRIMQKGKSVAACERGQRDIFE